MRWLELHARDRAADERDRGLDHPHLDAGRRGQAVLADGPRARTRCSTSTSCSTARWSCSAARSATASRSSRTTTASLPDVPVYGAELNQVWTNLIDNALQAMDGDGTLTIRTAARRRLRSLVEIGDTGPGIPTEIVRPHLRAVLHHQAGRPGHRPRPGHLLAHRRQQAPRRPVGASPSPGDTRFRVRLPLDAATARRPRA